MTGSPLIIDAAGPGVLLTGKIDPYLIRWVSPSAAAGHLCVVQDGSGMEKWASVANGANYVEADHLGPESVWMGLIVPTLSSGKLYIYTR